MPGVYDNGGLGPLLRQIFQRLRGLETQQQSIISDDLGRPVRTTGLVPGSNPPLYGDMYYQPATGARLMFQGYDSGAGTAYIAFYDANGNIVHKFDATGQHVYDASGTEQARLGQLVAGTNALYGVGVLNPYGGGLQQVGGYDVLLTSDTGTVTNTAWTAFSSPNSVTLQAGPSGNYLVSLAGFIETYTVNIDGEVGVSIDGGTVVGLAVLGAQSSQVVGTVGGTFQVNAPTSTPGESHTLEFYYKLTAAGSAEFGSFYFIVQPI